MGSQVQNKHISLICSMKHKNFFAKDSDEPKTSQVAIITFTMAKSDIKDTISEKNLNLATKLMSTSMTRGKAEKQNPFVK